MFGYVRGTWNFEHNYAIYSSHVVYVLIYNCPSLYVMVPIGVETQQKPIDWGFVFKVSSYCIKFIYRGRAFFT